METHVSQSVVDGARQASRCVVLTMCHRLWSRSASRYPPLGLGEVLIWRVCTFTGEEIDRVVKETFVSGFRQRMFVSLPASCSSRYAALAYPRVARCSSSWSLQRVRWAPLLCTLLVRHYESMCPATPKTEYERGCLLPTPNWTQRVPQVRTRLRDASGLAASGAGPRRCTAGVTPASVRTRDRRTEARTGPGPLCSRNGRPHPGFPGVT